MKKNLTLLVMATMLVSSVAAQPKHSRDYLNEVTHNGQRTRMIERAIYDGSYTHRLASFTTNYADETNRFTYDWAHRLTSVYAEMTGDDGYRLIDTVMYNDLSRLVRLEGWQYLYEEWVNVYYIEYTYDAAGNIASRTNYNNFGGEFEMGGIYTYTYNENHQILTSELEMGGTIYARDTYTYQNGLLNERICSSYNGYGLSPDFRMTYEYDDRGRLTLETDYSTEDGTNWALDKRYTYTYNNNGDMTEYHAYDNGNNELERRVYAYNTNIDLAKTLMPWNPEIDNRPVIYQSAHCYTTENWWTLDDQFRLQHICDYLYTYVDINDGVENEQCADGLRLYPNPARDIVYIEGIEGANVTIYDMMGRLVLNVEQAGTSINTSSLAAGCYNVVVRRDNEIAADRLIIK